MSNLNQAKTLLAKLEAILAGKAPLSDLKQIFNDLNTLLKEIQSGSSALTPFVKTGSVPFAPVLSNLENGPSDTPPNPFWVELPIEIETVNATEAQLSAILSHAQPQAIQGGSSLTLIKPLL